MDWEEAFSLSSRCAKSDTPLDTIINFTNHEGNSDSMTVNELHDIARFMSALDDAINKCLNEFAQGFKYNCPASFLTPNTVYTIKTFLESLKTRHKIVKYYISSALGYVEIQIFNSAFTMYDGTGRPLLN